MGINISVYKIKGIIQGKDIYPDHLYKYFDKEAHPTWDSCRRSGDSDFMDTIDFYFRAEGDEEDDFNNPCYLRPKDIPAAIQWVKQNVHESNQQRLIDVLEEMQKDEQLYFTVSY